MYTKVGNIKILSIGLSALFSPLDVIEIADPDFERLPLTETLTLYKVSNETDIAQRLKHDGYTFFWVGLPELALDYFRTVLYVKLLDKSRVEVCVPKVSGSFLGSYTSGK